MTTFFEVSVYLRLVLLLCRNGYDNADSKGKWYKYNDTFVEEFDMNDENLEAECFGGTYKATVYDTGMENIILVLCLLFPFSFFSIFFFPLVCWLYIYQISFFNVSVSVQITRSNYILCCISPPPLFLFFIFSLIFPFIYLFPISLVVNSYPETRHRYWNGYMLFYEAVNDNKMQNNFLHPARGPLIRQEAIIEGRFDKLNVS